MYMYVHVIILELFVCVGRAGWRERRRGEKIRERREREGNDKRRGERGREE